MKTQLGLQTTQSMSIIGFALVLFLEQSTPKNWIIVSVLTQCMMLAKSIVSVLTQTC
jgi:hypothetical protein